MAKRQKRFFMLADRPVNKDGFIKEWLDVGLVAKTVPMTRSPSIKIENGVVVELDGKKRDDFDLIDYFIADHSVDKTVAERSDAIDCVKFAQMLVDINCSARGTRSLVGWFDPGESGCHSSGVEYRRTDDDDAEDACPQDADEPGSRYEPEGFGPDAGGRRCRSCLSWLCGN